MAESIWQSKTTHLDPHEAERERERERGGGEGEGEGEREGERESEREKKGAPINPSRRCSPPPTSFTRPRLLVALPAGDKVFNTCVLGGHLRFKP